MTDTLSNSQNTSSAKEATTVLSTVAVGSAEATKPAAKEVIAAPAIPPKSNSAPATDKSGPVTPSKESSTSSRRRRSSRLSVNQDPIVAPGWGTQRDLERLARELSAGSGTSLPVAAVEAMMNSRGRGIRSSSRTKGAAQQQASAPTTSATPVSSAWADFMKEEGVADLYQQPGSETTRGGRKKKDASETESSSGAKRVYELPIGDSLEASPPKKKSKSQSSAGGVLLQTGTLDPSVVGRKTASTGQDVPPWQLMTPTRILPSGVKITAVFTSCNAAHSIAVDVSGNAYGWGRNEANQLGQQYPENVILPTILEDMPDKVHSAALGKSHTIFLMQDRTQLFAVGANKSGQCGVRTSTDVPNYRKCVMPENTTFVQVACGEDFSLVLDSEGKIYSAGSSEFGQLGNGETGEYFVSANKLAFANSNVFARRATFCFAPGEKLYTSNTTEKVVPLSEDIRIQYIACGKHHSLAVEAPSGQHCRVFSWGCGDYQVLGHGNQADEYYPRHVGALKNTMVANAASGKIILQAGAHCSLLQTPAGHVYYWGKHRSVGEATSRPQLVEALANNQHVVTHCAAGGQTVVCCTSLAQTVAWGQGPHGELGFGHKQKSSSKPNFVAALSGCRVAGLACGYGHTLFVVKDEDAEDAATVAKLDQIDTQEVAPLVKSVNEKSSTK